MAAEKSNKRSRPMSEEDHLAVENSFEAVRIPITELLQETKTRADKRLEAILLAHNRQWEAKEAQATAQVEVQKLNAQVSMVQRLKVLCKEGTPLDLDGEEKRLQEEIHRKSAEQVDVTVPAIDWDKWGINYMK